MFALGPALLCLALVAPPAQDAPPQRTGFKALLRDLGGDITHLPSRENFSIALGGGALALAAHPFDQDVNARLMNHFDGVNTFFAAGKHYGNTPEQVALSVGTYLFGRMTDKPRVAHLGMDLLRAQAVTELLVEPIKFATNRERPDGSDHLSFPSGHAAVTFAAAAVIERHLGWKGSLAAYTVAAYVSTSRLHDNVHYLSDVVFGAAVGTIAGRTVTRHGRDQWTLGPALVPGGVAIVATRIPS